MTGKLKVGISGWSYPEFTPSFYPPGLPSAEMLPFYARHFDTVEINSSFYRLPKPETFAEWGHRVPPGFTFSVKASRFLTHLKKLRDPGPALDLLFSSMCSLGDRMGPVLFQLPPNWGVNLDRLYGLIRELPGGPRYAIEFRDPSWHVPEVHKLLEKHGVAFCVYDLEGFQSPIQLTADFVYVRLHGSEGKYFGSYHGPRMRFWKKQVAEWLKSGRDVYFYFDNTLRAEAVQDALELKQAFEKTAAGPAPQELRAA